MHRLKVAGVKSFRRFRRSFIYAIALTIQSMNSIEYKIQFKGKYAPIVMSVSTTTTAQTNTKQKLPAYSTVLPSKKST